MHLTYAFIQSDFCDPSIVPWESNLWPLKLALLVDPHEYDLEITLVYIEMQVFRYAVCVLCRYSILLSI